MRTESIHSVYLHESNYWQFSTIWWLACENRRLSSLFATGDVSRGGTSGSQRQIFHTDVVKSLRNPVRSADWSTEYSYIVWGTVYEWQTKAGAHQMEPPSPIQALGVNPFPSRFIIRTVPRGDFARRRWEEPIATTKWHCYCTSWNSRKSGAEGQTKS